MVDNQLPVSIDVLHRMLAEASTPEQARDVETKAEGVEDYMRRTGLYSTAEIRPVNETRIRARCKLGRLLAGVERASHPGKGKLALSGLTSLLKKLGMTKPTALAAQRIGAIPDEVIEKVLFRARANDILTPFETVLKVGRPHWYKEIRNKKHADIKAKADKQAAPNFEIGPFPLILADPPWKFETYSEAGLDRTPDQHYPTLSDAEIIDFRVHGRKISELAHRDAALFLWCTSSNVHRALAVMAGWGFTFKTSAVWVKDKTGQGLVFRNRHELILYGIRGAMPGPLYQPPSVFAFPRTAHSAKPPEIRDEIARMYPHFDATTRCELFSRDDAEGWSSYGFEAGALAA